MATCSGRTCTHHIDGIGQKSPCASDKIGCCSVLYDDGDTTTNERPALAQVACGISLLRRVRARCHIEGIKYAFFDELLESLPGVLGNNLSSEEVKLWVEVFTSREHDMISKNLERRTYNICVIPLFS